MDSGRPLCFVLRKFVEHPGETILVNRHEVLESRPQDIPHLTAILHETQRKSPKAESHILSTHAEPNRPHA